MKKRIKDDEYKLYIEGLSCYICGHQATGTRKIYNEYLDEYVEKFCKNTAHHVDTEMTRAKNDHRIIPLCSHYVVSGKGTCNCHEQVHSKGKYKTRETQELFVQAADEYYEMYLQEKELSINEE